MKPAKRVETLAAGVKLSLSQSQRPRGTARGMSRAKLCRLTCSAGILLGSRMDIASTATTCDIHSNSFEIFCNFFASHERASLAIEATEPIEYLPYIQRGVQSRLYKACRGQIVVAFPAEVTGLYHAGPWQELHG